MLRNTPDRYGLVAQSLHWLVVALIIGQFIIGHYADGLDQGVAKLAWMTRHKQFGMTIFGLAVVRVLWRLASPAPALPVDMAAWQQRLARLNHFVLYGLILVQPLVGWLISSAGNHPVSYFELFTLPNLITPDEHLKELFEELHETLAWILLGVASLHAVAGLWHHFVRRDHVLRRMLPFTRVRSG